jgi:hypothetical protein
MFQLIYQHASNRQSKTLTEETFLFVQEPSSAHAEYQINEDNQDNSSSDRHIAPVGHIILIPSIN